MITWLRRKHLGVSGAIFAGLLGTGLLLLTMGLVVDGGAVYMNRQTQQEVAQNVLSQLTNYCAKNSATCASSTAASTYAANLMPAGSTLVEVCGPGLGLATGGTTCMVQSGKPSDCQVPTGLYGQSYIRLRTKSTDATGSHVINDVSDTPDSVAPYGCAQVSLIAPNGASLNVSLPIALPACYANDDKVERVLVDYNPSSDDDHDRGRTCTVQTANGPITEHSISGFAQTSLKTPEIGKYCDGDDEDDVPVSITVHRDSTERSDLCGNTLTLSKASSLVGKTLFFPVVTPPVAKGQGDYEFDVHSFRAFTVTGFRLKVGSAGGKSSSFWSSHGCDTGSYCLSGYFTSAQSNVLFPFDMSKCANIPNYGLMTAVPLY